MNSSNQSNEQLHSKDFDDNINDNKEIDNDDNASGDGNIIDVEDSSGLALSNLINEYDQCINSLKQQYQLSKELRRKSEVDSKAMEHRISLLQNQEKYVIIQFNNTKKKIEQILKNRAIAELTIKHNINHSNSHSKNSVKRKIKNNLSEIRQYSSGNVSASNKKDLKKTNSKKMYSNNSNSNKDDDIMMNEMSANQCKNNKYEEENFEDQELNYKKKKIKEELLNKLKEEEEERLRLENEIAMIEKEELRLLKLFNTKNNK